MINKLAKQVHELGQRQGWYEQPKNIGEMLMLIVTEVAEACECDRKDGYMSRKNDVYAAIGFVREDDFKEYFEEKVKDTFEDELADIIIRVMDLAAHKGVDLEAHIEAKMRYNELRQYKHGGKKY